MIDVDILNEEKIINFIKQADLIPVPLKSNLLLDSRIVYLWDGNYSSEEYNSMFNRCMLPDGDPNKLYIYTLIDEDDEGYIFQGKYLINRIGYFFAKNRVDISSIRYW